MRKSGEGTTTVDGNEFIVARFKIYCEGVMCHESGYAQPPGYQTLFLLNGNSPQRCMTSKDMARTNITAQFPSLPMVTVRLFDQFGETASNECLGVVQDLYRADLFEWRTCLLNNSYPTDSHTCGVSCQEFQNGSIGPWTLVAGSPGHCDNTGPILRWTRGSVISWNNRSAVSGTAHIPHASPRFITHSLLSI